MVNLARAGRVFCLAIIFAFTSAFFPCVVKAGVVSFRHESEIFNSVVGPNAIYVVHDLRGKQPASYRFFNNDSMLMNIPLTISIWMIWPANFDVPIVSGNKANVVSVLDSKSIGSGNASDVGCRSINDLRYFGGCHASIGHHSYQLNRQKKSLVSGNSVFSHVLENDLLAHTIFFSNFDTRLQFIVVGSKLIGRDSKFFNESHDDNYIPCVSISQDKKSRYSLTLYESIGSLDKEPNDNILEIKAQGSRVIIPTIANVTVRKRLTGASTIWETLSSPPVEFNVNRATEWAFRMDTVSLAQFLNKDIMDKYANDAAEQTKAVMDEDYLSSVYLKAASYNQGITAGLKSGLFNLGVTGSMITLSKANIVTYLLMLEAVLNEADVPQTDRFVVLPTWARFLLDDSKVQDAAYTGLSKSNLIDTGGYITNIGRFRVYESNLYTSVTDTGKTCFNIIAGHKDAITTATQIVDTQYFDKFENTWGKGMKGLQVYDWEVIKGQALAVLYATISTLV